MNTEEYEKKLKEAKETEDKLRKDLYNLATQVVILKQINQEQLDKYVKIVQECDKLKNEAVVKNTCLNCGNELDECSSCLHSNAPIRDI